MSDIIFSSIPDAIDAIKRGEVIIVVDDEDRENEGDFVVALDCITPEIVNFMATHGRGLICAPIIEFRSHQLDLNRMVSHNTDPMGTAFTVSVDLKGDGVTTGISASDRAKTLKALVDDKKTARDFSRPGHIFPLVAKEGGVLRRTGHTEAAIDLARLAGFHPAGAIVEILNEDGSMARLLQLSQIASKFNLKLINIEQLVAYRMNHDSLLKKHLTFDYETRFGNFLIHVYEQTNNKNVHFALTRGKWTINDSVLTRVMSSEHSDILDIFLDKNKNLLNRIFKKINQNPYVALVFIGSDSDATSLLNRFYEIEKRSKKGIKDIPEAAMDNRDFGIGAQILHNLRISQIKLLSNSPKSKRVGMHGYGLEIKEVVPF